VTITTQLLVDMGVYLNATYSSLYAGKYALGTNLFLSLMPEDPDVCMAVYEQAGVQPVITFGATQITQPAMQVITRHTSYETGRVDAQEMFEIFVDIAEQTINSNTYHRIAPIASPAMYQRDNNNRVLFSTNFSVMRVI